MFDDRENLRGAAKAAFDLYHKDADTPDKTYSRDEVLQIVNYYRIYYVNMLPDDYEDEEIEDDTDI